MVKPFAEQVMSALAPGASVWRQRSAQLRSRRYDRTISDIRQ
jgi:hypothetical protein